MHGCGTPPRGMTAEQDRQFWEQLAEALAQDAGEAAQAHLAAGRAIYYGDPAYPGAVVKQYPDGHRQLVRFARPSGTEIVLQDL